MKVRTEDYGEILIYLVNKRWEGEEFVAYCNDGMPVDREQLYFFSNSEEAVEFCYEMATDVDQYDYMAIRSTYRVMERAKADPDKLIQNTGVVDVGAMVSQYLTEKLAEEISNNSKKLKTMNMTNLEYLQDQVKYTGFGDQLKEKLQEAIEKGSAEFKLDFQTKFGKDTIDAELSFSRSKSTDMYFFNSYRAEIQKEGSDEKLSQTFYINDFSNRDNNIYLKEAFNLMSGRCVNKQLVNKEGVSYNAWLQMDFKQSNEHGNFKIKHYHENFGYNLEEALSKHPIKELANEEYKSNLMDSLKKGNLQSVTFQKDGSEVKKFVEACPQFKSVNVYDSNMKREGHRQTKEAKEGQDNNQSQRHNERQAVADDDAPDIPEQKNKKRRRQSM